MKISDVKAYVLRKPLERALSTARSDGMVRTHALVRVTTDSGLTGLGEGVGYTGVICHIVEELLAPRVRGADPFDVTSLYRRMVESDVLWDLKGSLLCAASAVEIACWDIKGKALGVPVYQLLGGRMRDRIEAYASDLFWGPPEAMARDAARWVDQGFRTVKCHIGRLPPAEEIPRVRAIRHAIGSATGLMIDLNCGYEFETALEAARRWAEHDILWLEEPLAPYQVDALGRLRESIVIPIAAGENEFTIHGFKPLFDRGAVDYAMPDVARAGGLGETQRICAVAAAYGVTVSPHSFGSGVHLAATLHLMAATPNTRLLEYDVARMSVMDELFVEPLRVEAGNVIVPETPGLGVELSDAVLTQYA